MNPLGEQDFRLGVWLVVPKLNCLVRDGKSTHVEPKVMQVLVCLAEAGDVVPKEKLMARVWAGTFVTDDVLTRSISELRKVFEDDPKNPQYIQTIPKGGYRLLVRAEAVIDDAANAARGSGGGTGASVAAAASASMAPIATAETSAVSARRVARGKWVAAAAALGVLLLMALALWRSSLSVSPTSSAAPGRAMLAVLPFQNLNNDASQDYFADGLTAEMISQLGRLPSERVGVIAWNSMMRYKGVKKTEAEVGAALGANYVLEGTVRREAQHVRVTAELVKIGDPSHIWASSYDGDLSDVLALQTRVAREIAGEIQLRLTPEQQARLGNPPRVNGEGYDAYLKGRAIIESGGRRMAGKTEVEHLKTAMDLTPGYAPPYVALAAHYRDEASHGLIPSKVAYAGGRSAIEKALQIDPNSSVAHREMGWIDWRGEWDFPAADREYRLALQLNPGEAGTHEQYSLYLKSQRRYDEALREINRCLELSPLEPVSHANAGTLLGLLGRYDESLDQFGKALELGPSEAYVHERMGAVLLWQAAGSPGRRLERVTRLQAIREFLKAVELSNRQPEKLAWFGYALAGIGKNEHAHAILEEIQRNPREQYVSPFYVAMLYAGVNDSENALSWLEKAYDEHDEWMVYLRVYPEFASLQSEPRFQELVRRLNLP